MRQRWGVFAVRDHISNAPFVSDVLLYDRLIIPVPGKSPEGFWSKCQPELQAHCIAILNEKTKRQDGLALTVPWDATKRERFKNRMSIAAAVATQQRSPDQQFYVDPYEMTRQLIKDEFLPPLPTGVAKAWTIAAYSSTNSFHKDVSTAEPDRRRRLAALLTHRFLTPAEHDPDQELLKKAVELAMTASFRRKRANFYA